MINSNELNYINVFLEKKSHGLFLDDFTIEYMEKNESEYESDLCLRIE